jgi:hypothetical protein
MQQKMQHIDSQRVAKLLIFALFPGKESFVDFGAKEMLKWNVKTLQAQ